MTEARTLLRPLPLALPYSAATGRPSLDDELSDDDLEQVVGGLARTRDATSQDARIAEPSFIIALAPVHEMAHRVSA